MRSVQAADGATAKLRRIDEPPASAPVGAHLTGTCGDARPDNHGELNILAGMSRPVLLFRR